MASPTELKSQVQDRGLCTACGACVGMCPYIYTAGEKVAVVYPCGSDDGACYRVCPRTPTDPLEMDRHVFGRQRSDHVLGEHSEIYFSRACDSEAAARGQYGGTVSALTAFLMRDRRIEAALLARGGGAVIPEPVVATSVHDILACAGSKYSACPTLSVLPGAAGEYQGRIAVVGRPCQVMGLRKMQQLAREEKFSHLPATRLEVFTIGLFCFWALTPEFYTFIAGKAAGEEITGVDVPLEGVTITTAGDKKIVVPVDEVRAFIRPACHECFDPTSELADVAVGSTEYDPDWNTLIVRTRAGRSLVEEAIEAGVIKVKPYPEDRLPVLRRAVLNKKLRVLDTRRGDHYLRLPPGYWHELMLNGGLSDV